jgi:hypothetical protein
VGQSVWNTSSIKSGKENIDNLIGSLAFNLARVRVEGPKFIHQLSIDLNYVNPSVFCQDFIIDMSIINFFGPLFPVGSSV